MPLATSAASKLSMLPRACPDSARAIINSALKVRISPSDSSLVRSQALPYSASLPAFASASSARLRNRVSGVLRSWAMLSETSFNPIMRASIRSSMALRFPAAPPARHPPAEIACHDALGGTRHGIDAPQYPARHEDAAAKSEHHHDQ